MKWKKVKGPGDMVRGVSIPNWESMPRSLDPRSELGWQMDNYLVESKQKWGLAASQRQWAGEARRRAQRDADIGGVERHGNRMGPFKPLPTLTLRKAKPKPPKSIMYTTHLPPAESYPASRRRRG